MTNWEKDKERLLKMAVCGESFAVNKKTGEIDKCISLRCVECLFCENGCCQHEKLCAKWLDEEYKEPKKPEIDWTKVPVDTPVLAWDDGDDQKFKLHFAKFENNKIYAFVYGRTSHSAKSFAGCAYWDYVEIAPGIDCSKWYKE